MGKAKINLEIDQDSLANAKAYVARHGGSLNKLVDALFESLGRDERLDTPLMDGSTKVLSAVSSGKLSISDAAQLLDLPDAGLVLQLLAERRLPLPKLQDADIRRQAEHSLAALRNCMVKPVGKVTKRKSAATTE